MGPGVPQKVEKGDDSVVSDGRKKTVTLGFGCFIAVTTHRPQRFHDALQKNYYLNPCAHRTKTDLASFSFR
jgi:hypothetical protein